MGCLADHVVPTEEYAELYLHLPIRIQSVDLEYSFRENAIQRIYTLRLSPHCTVNNTRLGCEKQVVNFESENKFSFSEINIKKNKYTVGRR